MHVSLRRSTGPVATLLVAALAVVGCDDAKPVDKPAASSAPSVAVKNAAPTGSTPSAASALTASAAASPEPAPTPVPCDGPELAELAKQLDTAGGVGVDLDKDKAAIQAAAAAVTGKRFAFKNCVFKSQGNDQVSFAGSKDAQNDVICKMAGGEDGNRAFRDAAMALQVESEKLRLDVVGTVALTGAPPIERYRLTECTITVHE
jgi:hypothetical protein